jgi:predicted DNA-binding protein
LDEVVMGIGKGKGLLRASLNLDLIQRLKIAAIRSNRRPCELVGEAIEHFLDSAEENTTSQVVVKAGRGE